MYKRQILKRLFQGNDDDVSVIDGIEGKLASYTWFSELYQKSLRGVTDDFRFTLSTEFEDLDLTNKTPVFMHAINDPMTSHDKISDLARQLGGVVHTFHSGGHFVVASHPIEVWPVIGNWANGSALG